MFALGQKQTFATQNGMSALPPIATSIAFFGMSALAKSGYLLCRADTMQRNVRFAPLVDAFPSEFVRRVLDRIEDFLTYGKTNGAAKAIIPCMLRVQRQGSRGGHQFLHGVSWSFEPSRFATQGAGLIFFIYAAVPVSD